MSSHWLRYVEDPTWFPFDYDARGLMRFVHAPRDLQRRTSFLDPRFLSHASKSEAIAVRDLPMDVIHAAAKPMHFIFHTSFCCSTLAARAVDIPGVSMGIKEPSVLADICSIDFATPGGVAVLEVALDLISRPLGAGETQIVKPSNFCNPMIPAMLQLRPNAKAVVMHSSLLQFLRAVARRDTEGRQFGRKMYVEFNRAFPLGGAAEERQFLLADLQIAAKGWILQAAFLAAIAREHPSRVRLLSQDQFLAAPTRVLHEMADFFALPLDETQCAAIAKGPTFSEHAKRLGERFDASDFNVQQEHDGAAHAKEIAEALEWAARASQQWNAPVALADTLF